MSLAALPAAHWISSRANQRANANWPENEARTMESIPVASMSFRASANVTLLTRARRPPTGRCVFCDFYHRLRFVHARRLKVADELECSDRFFMLHPIVPESRRGVCGCCQRTQMSFKSPCCRCNQSQLSSGASFEYSLLLFLLSHQGCQGSRLSISSHIFFFDETIHWHVQVADTMPLQDKGFHSFPAWLWEFTPLRVLRVYQRAASSVSRPRNATELFSQPFGLTEFTGLVFKS